MRFIDKYIIDLQIRLADKKIQQSFRCKHKNKVVSPLKSQIASSSNHTIITLLQVFFQIINNLASIFIYQRFCRNNQCKVFSCALLDLLLHEHPHNKRFTHRSRTRIAEIGVVQVIIYILLRAKKTQVRFSGYCKIMTLKFCKYSFKCRRGLIVALDNFLSLIIPGV